MLPSPFVDLLCSDPNAFVYQPDYLLAAATGPGESDGSGALTVPQK